MSYVIIFDPYMVLCLFLFPILLYIFDLYYPFKYFKPTQTTFDVSLGVSIGAVLVAAISYADRTFFLSRLTFGVIIVFLIPTLISIRILYDYLFKNRFLDKKVLIIGTSDLAYETVNEITKTPYAGMEIVGLVSETDESVNEERSRVPILGNQKNLLSLIEWYKIQLVVLAIDSGSKSSETKIMAGLLKKHVTVTSATYLLEKLTGCIPFQVVENHYILGLMARVRMLPYLKLKRVIDLFAGFFLFVLFLPVLLAAVSVLCFSGFGNVFFVQDRIGLNGIPFKLLKLKTMTDVKNGKQSITKFGKWLRKYRIDEIPQLINVIKGDMSLVGPRPEVPFFVERSCRKIPLYEAVFSVKPGLTGWAQVKFRHATSVKDYDQKFRYNLFYLKNLSLFTDIFILIKTVRIVLLGLGK